MPSTVAAGASFTVTWQSVFKSISTDYIGLVLDVGLNPPPSWYTYVSSGVYSGSVVAKMPNSPGSLYRLAFFHSGKKSYSSVITCTVSSVGAVDAGNNFIRATAET